MSGSASEYLPRCASALAVRKEVQATEAYAALRAGEIDVLVHWLVTGEPDLTSGPAIDRQGRAVAAAVSHPLARQETVSVEDLAEQPVAWPPADPFARR